MSVWLSAEVGLGLKLTIEAAQLRALAQQLVPAEVAGWEHLAQVEGVGVTVP